MHRGVGESPQRRHDDETATDAEQTGHETGQGANAGKKQPANPIPTETPGIRIDMGELSLFAWRMRRQRPQDQTQRHNQNHPGKNEL